MGKQRDEGSESVTQQVQSRDIDVKKSDKFSSEYNLSLLFQFITLAKKLQMNIDKKEQNFRRNTCDTFS